MSDLSTCVNKRIPLKYRAKKFNYYYIVYWVSKFLFPQSSGRSLLQRRSFEIA